MRRSIAPIAIITIVAFAAILTMRAVNVPLIASVIGSQQKIVYAQCITTFTDLPQNRFTITDIMLNEDKVKDALVQHAGGESCGSGGCVYELCMSDSSAGFVHIPFGFAAHSVTQLQTMTLGMHDLILNDDKELIMNWNGSQYVLRGR